jgi:hypothetical protein
MSKKQSGQVYIEGQFVGLRWELLDSPAWKHLSMGARLLYIALARRLNFDTRNNGRIYLSTRFAMEEIGTTSKNSISRWYRELQHYGFIVQTTPPTLGSKGLAAHWRLTDVAYGKLDGRPIKATKDYLKWTGEVFPAGPQKQISCPHNGGTLPPPSVHRGMPPPSVHTETDFQQKPAPINGTYLDSSPSSSQRSEGSASLSQAPVSRRRQRAQ